MKLLIALCVSTLIPAAAFARPPDALESALVTLRGRVKFVDLSQAGRRVAAGETLLSNGLTAVFLFMDFGGVGPAPLAGAIGLTAGIAGLGLTSVGVVKYASGQLERLVWPRPRLKVLSAREYMSAAGLNQFMRLGPRAQYAVASGEPALAEYLIRLADAYQLSTKYGLLPTP